MILNYSHHIAFMHIPKCAGSSVKDQLRAIDETGGRFERAEPHPRFGRVHRAHLPLWLLAELYPDDFAVVRQSDVFAVLRDPQARFASSLAQRIEQFGKRDPFALSAGEVRAEVDTVIDFLTQSPDDPRLEFCHFIRQRDFTHLNETQIATHLYLLEDVAALMADIGARTGQVIRPDARSNQKVAFRTPMLKAPVLAVNALLRQILPVGVHTALKETGKGLLGRKGKGAVWAKTLDAPDIRAFVADHYRADAALVAQAGPRAAPV